MNVIIIGLEMTFKQSILVAEWIYVQG